MNKEQKDWFVDWFDSPFYDLLYSKRNDSEAAFFIDNLLTNIDIAPNSSILDLACGKGRHSVYLHKKGFRVTGVDLSKRSIDFARQFETAGLEFGIQDMRIPLKNKQFDLIVNLFTSFGYFDDLADNVQVLKSVKSMLLPEGTFVMDYLNGEKLIQTIVAEEAKTFPEAHFKIKRKVENGFVIKSIELQTPDFKQDFLEKVRLFSLQELANMFEQASLKIVKIFGDYSLNTYEPNTSDRIILIAKTEHPTL